MTTFRAALFSFVALSALTASSSGWADPVATAQGQALGFTITNFATINSGNTGLGVSGITAINGNIGVLNSLNGAAYIFSDTNNQTPSGALFTTQFNGASANMISNQPVSNGALAGGYNAATSQNGINLLSYSSGTFSNQELVANLSPNSMFGFGTSVVASASVFSSTGSFVATDMVGFNKAATAISPEAYNILSNPTGAGTYYSAMAGYGSSAVLGLNSGTVSVLNIFGDPAYAGASFNVGQTFYEPGFPGDGTNIMMNGISGPISSSNSAINGDYLIAGGISGMNSSGIDLFDPTTGAFTPLATGGNELMAITFDPATNSYLVGGSNNIYRISFNQVPEPPSILLLGFGAIALGAARSRRARRAFSLVKSHLG